MKKRMKGGERTQITSLQVSVQCWPTPRAAANGSDSGSAKRQAQGENLGLKDAAKLWPSPHGFQAGNGPDGNEFSKAVREWSTPKSSDADKGGPNMTGSKGDLPLPNQAAHWATPMSADDGHKVTGASKIDLIPQVNQWPTPNSRDHKGADLNTRTGGQA